MATLGAVRTLRLACEREEWIGRGRLLVEDALRVAALAPTRGRLLVIRRLDIGRIDPERPSGAVATRLEAAVQEAGRRAVRFDDPGAAGADAVFFPDAATAPVALLLHLVSGRQADEWFWPLVLPSTAGRGPPRTWSIRELMLSAAAAMEPGGVVRLVHTLHASNRLEQVLQALQPPDGAGLIAALPPGMAQDLTSEPAVPVPAEWARILETWVSRWGAADLRTVWLMAVALVDRRPGMLVHPLLLAHAAALSRRLAAHQRLVATSASEDRWIPQDAGSLASAPLPHAAEENRPPPTVVSEFGKGVPTWQQEPAVRLDLAPSDLRGGLSTSGNAGLSSDVAPADSPAPPEGAASLPESSSARRTAFGGFFFLIRVLDFLGLQEAHASSPWLLECDFARYTLRSLARCSGVPRDDASILALQLHELPPMSPDVARVVSAWSVAARRWCRTSRVPCRRLAQRDAWILSTPTHVDVVFDLRSTDIRIRRLGLDTDPGWVAWLGKVVTYHYVEGGYRDDPRG